MNKTHTKLILHIEDPAPITLIGGDKFRDPSDGDYYIYCHVPETGHILVDLLTGFIAMPNQTSEVLEEDLINYITRNGLQKIKKFTAKIEL